MSVTNVNRLHTPVKRLRLSENIFKKKKIQPSTVYKRHI